MNFHGINPVFRENKGGKVYGITFIDNRKGAVMNGSELGKKYSGQVLVKRFNVPIAIGRAAGEKEEPATQGFGWRRAERYHDSQANWMQDSAEPFLNLMKAEKGHSEPINPNLKRRRKRRRGLSR